ncbi:MAG: MmoB/DmpM family protein [Candidatus Bathyarchaeia archaeon]
MVLRLQLVCNPFSHSRMEKDMTNVREVGIEVMSGDEAEAVVAAIEKDNLGCKVMRFKAYLRITVPQKLVLNRSSVESFLGRDWKTRDLEQIMANYFGILTEWNDESVVIEWLKKESEGASVE